MKQKQFDRRGKDDTTNYEELLHFVSDKVKQLYVSEMIIKKLSVNSFRLFQLFMKEKQWKRLFYGISFGRTNRTVVYSPACECEDKYGDYEKLGTQFKNAIAQL